MKTNSDLINANKKLSAQSNTLCEVKGASMGHQLTIESIISKCKLHSESLYTICSLQLKFALRISEVLNLKYSDIDFQGRAIIKGLKGSNDRIIYVSEYPMFKNINRNSKELVFSHINRFYVYREYKKLGIYKLLEDNSNTSVTHFNRYLSQAVIEDNSEDLRVKRQLLGHKSSKNTFRYHNKFK